MYANRRNLRDFKGNRGRETRRWRQILDQKWKYSPFVDAPYNYRRTVRSLWTWLWGRYHLPQNVFLVYAYDLVLMSASICDVQKMIDLCVDELYTIDIILNISKCAILRFGPTTFCDLALTCKANSAFHPSGVGNEYQLRLGRQRQVWFIPVSGWTWGVQVKLWDPLRTRAIPEHLKGVFLYEALYKSTSTFTFTFGPRYSKSCAQICIGQQGSPVKYHDKTKYLGIMLRSTVKFSIDLSHMKSKFYSAFNSLFHKTDKFRDELVSAYCKPYLIHVSHTSA